VLAYPGCPGKQAVKQMSCLSVDGINAQELFFNATDML